MSTWANRARAHFSQERQNGTTETTERVCDFSQERQNSTTETTESPLLTVLTVQSGRFCEKHDIGLQADRDPFDDRVTCTACRNLWQQGNHCMVHRKAELSIRGMAQDFVRLPQRCAGFAPLARQEALK